MKKIIADKMCFGYFILGLMLLFFTLSYPQMRKQLMDDNGCTVMKDLYSVQDQLM